MNIKLLFEAVEHQLIIHDWQEQESGKFELHHTFSLGTALSPVFMTGSLRNYKCLAIVYHMQRKHFPPFKRKKNRIYTKWTNGIAKSVLWILIEAVKCLLLRIESITYSEIDKSCTPVRKNGPNEDVLQSSHHHLHYISYKLNL